MPHPKRGARPRPCATCARGGAGFGKPDTPQLMSQFEFLLSTEKRPLPKADPNDGEKWEIRPYRR